MEKAFPAIKKMGEKLNEGLEQMITCHSEEIPRREALEESGQFLPLIPSENPSSFRFHYLPPKQATERGINGFIIFTIQGI
jgi:hypothetical protein